MKRLVALIAVTAVTAGSIAGGAFASDGGAGIACRASGGSLLGGGAVYWCPEQGRHAHGKQ